MTRQSDSKAGSGDKDLTELQLQVNLLQRDVPPLQLEHDLL